MPNPKKARRVRRLNIPRPVGDWGPEVVRVPRVPRVPRVAPAESPRPGVPTLDLLEPQGTAAVVLAWVGNSSDRARMAIVAERERSKPRSSLVAKLERIERRGKN